MRRSLAVITIAVLVGGYASDAEARLDLYIDKSTQRMAVVQDGYMRYMWPVSTGRDGYATPNGVYFPEHLERSYFSREYYNSPMPYAIFFHNGYAIHGSYDLNRLGGPASHGSIRLYPQHAAILFAMVEEEGPENTTIVVGGDGAPIPRAPRYRDMDELVRSVVPGDGGNVMPGPRGMPPRDWVEPPSWPSASNDRFATLRGDPRGDLDRNTGMPGWNGNPQFAGPGAVWGRDPRSEPHRDMVRDAVRDSVRDGVRETARAAGRYAEAPIRQGDNGPSAPGAPPLPPPRRDTDNWKEAPRMTRSEPVGAAGGRGSTSPKAPVRLSDGDPRLGAPVPLPSSAPHRDADNTREVPRIARSEEDESTEGRLGANSSEPMLTGGGYKILPKSYWAGAAWRWRANGEPDAR